MNILLDFITVKWPSGAGEYHRRVVLTLMERLLKEHRDVNLFALYDSHYGVAYNDLQEEVLNKKYPIRYVDIQQTNLLSVERDYKIDRFFIACAQYIGQYKEIEMMKCEVICVIHDLTNEESAVNRLGAYLKLIEPKYQQGVSAGLRLAKYFFQLCTKRIADDAMDGLYDLKFVIRLFRNNPNTCCIAVSEYTKMSLIYNYAIDPKRIEVLYTPLRQIPEMKPVENEQLKQLIEEKKKFYLAVSCQRRSKNPEKLIHAFIRYAEYDSDAHLVLISYPRQVDHPRIINLRFLSDSDLAHAMQDCYALVYPSFFEGFGLPPLETMRYGKPVLASNATSIPEVLQEAPIYFCPIFETDIFRAFFALNKDNYPEYVQRSLNRVEQIMEKQETDLQILVDKILS